MSEDNDGLDEGLLRPVLHDRPEAPELTDVTNRALKLGSDRRLPFVVVAQDVYCVVDRYQCRYAGKVTDMDSYYFVCPSCLSRYQVAGQDFVDWCKFKEQGIVR